MDVGSISKVKVILEISGKGVSQRQIVSSLSPNFFGNTEVIANPEKSKQVQR